MIGSDFGVFFEVPLFIYFKEQIESHLSLVVGSFVKSMIMGLFFNFLLDCVEGKIILPPSQFVCLLFYFRMSQNIVILLKIKSLIY